VNAITLASLASAPAPPQNVKLETKQLENDSTIKWEAPAEGESLIAGYEIVWRPTTSAEWENVEPAGMNHQLTVKRSKDNVYFGVRSFDKKSNRSLVVVPQPER
jgi:Fibronectin type III domain